MKYKLVSLLSACLLILPTVYGCDGKKDSKNSAASSNSQASATADASSSAPNDGKTYYSRDKIRSFDVGGFNLNMSITQIEAKLLAEHWHGRMQPMRPGDDIEDNATVFVLPKKEIAFFRNKAPAPEGVRVSGITYIQKFDLAHTTKELAEAVIKKYGKPTDGDVENGGELRWLPVPVQRKNDGPADAQFRSPNYYALTGNTGEGLSIEFVATISPTEIKIEIVDHDAAEKDIAALKAAQENREKNKMQQNDKAEKVQF